MIDPLGDAVTAAALRCLAPCGRLVVVGFAAGEIPQIRSNYLLVKNVGVLGLNWADRRDREPIGPGEVAPPGELPGQRQDEEREPQQHGDHRIESPDREVRHRLPQRRRYGLRNPEDRRRVGHSGRSAVRGHGRMIAERL